MRTLSSLTAEFVRHYLTHKRVMLVSTTDPYTNLRRGDIGTVTLVDDYGTVHVKWDNGSTLGLITGEDEWRVLDDDEQ